MEIVDAGAFLPLPMLKAGGWLNVKPGGAVGCADVPAVLEPKVNTPGLFPVAKLKFVLVFPNWKLEPAGGAVLEPKLGWAACWPNKGGWTLLVRVPNPGPD